MRNSPKIFFATPFLVVFLSAFGLGPGCTWQQMVSVDESGAPGDRAAGAPTVSADGRYIAFDSSHQNLVAGVTSDHVQVYRRDMLTGTTVLVSVGIDLLPGNSQTKTNANSVSPSISADGRYIAFSSYASNITAGDNNEQGDIFVRDMLTNTTTLASVSNAGIQGDAHSTYPSISADGQFVTFVTKSDELDLVNCPGNFSYSDIFVHDLQMSETRCVSVNSGGLQSDYYSGQPHISANGRYIAFYSAARNLVPNDTNNRNDIFVHDLQTAVTKRVSIATDGSQANDESSVGGISADGRYIIFSSVATNLVAGDTNGFRDVFRHDQLTGETIRISRANFGSDGFPFYSFSPAISADGRLAAFSRCTVEIVPPWGDGPHVACGLFTYDTLTEVLTLESTGLDDVMGDDGGYNSEFSADSRYLAYSSNSTNLGPNVTNGSQQVYLRALSRPTITTITPDSLPIGVTTSVTITGSNFMPDAIPQLENAQFDNIQHVDENTITADVTAAAGTPAGAQDMFIRLPGTGPGQWSGTIASCVGCVTFSM